MAPSTGWDVEGDRHVPYVQIEQFASLKEVIEKAKAKQLEPFGLEYPF